MKNDCHFGTIRQVAAIGPLSEHELRIRHKQDKLPGIYVGNRFLVNYGLLMEQLDAESRKQTEAVQ